MIKQARGFTLVELLIVMVLLAIAAAMVGPRLWGMVEPDPARDIPRLLGDRIDRMRGEAIIKTTAQDAVVNLVDNTLSDSDGKAIWTPPEGWQFTALPNVEVRETATTTLVTKKEEAPPDRIALRFNPDGSANEARFQLTGPDSGQGWTIAIAPLTGRMTMTPLNERDHAH
ncbi:type II secretion system protein [Chitinimonas sp.]|uniref:type II secretion system protein n=1 Tax=Chitinimonas sp. TaxID=1934313 RepID=UPI0035B0FDC8